MRKSLLLLIGIILWSATFSLGGLPAFHVSRHLVVFFNHVHHHHVHQLPDNSSQGPLPHSHTHAHNHTHVIDVAIQAAILVPPVIGNSFLLCLETAQFFGGEEDPPLDSFEGSIFRPPILA